MGSEYKLSHVYPQSKPFMEDNGRRKLQQKRAAPDLRVQTLTQEAAKRQRPMQEYGQDAENQPDVCQPQEPVQYAPVQRSRPPATDFSGFLQQLNQERQGGQQLPGYMDARAQQHQQQQQQLLQKSPGMLDKLINQHSLHAAPTSALELNSMMSLDRTFPPDASRDGFIRAPSAAAAADAAGSTAAAAGAAAGTDRWHLRHLEQIPWDWSGKSRAKFGSPVPFAVLQERAGTSLQSDCAAASLGNICKDTATSSQQRLSQALIQWQHPAAPMSSSLISALRADKEGASSLASRVAHWQQALRSAYAAVRHGHCPVLYVVGQAFRQHFTAVICSSGVMGYHGLHAVISRSNKQLRSYLASMGCYGVQAGTLEQQQQQQPGGRRAAGTATTFDGQPGSQLLLAGPQKVQCLCAALLSLPWCETDQPDVPLLSAPVQFLYAQLCPLRLQALPDSVLDQQQQQQGNAALQPLHYAELAGSSCIMPWTMHRLLKVLRDTQGDVGFDAWLDTEAYNSSVNLLPSVWQQVAAAAAAGSKETPAAAADQQQEQQQWRVGQLGVSASEEQQWQGSGAVLQGRVLKQIRVAKDTGEIAARLG